VLRLVDDEAERHGIGDAAKAHLLEHRTMQAMAPQWARALVEAGELRRHAAAA